MSQQPEDNLNTHRVAHGPLLAIVTLALASIALLITSCSTTSRSVSEFPQVDGASFVGNKVCSECHTNYTRTFAMGPHARAHFRDAAVPGDGIGCESCHGPGSKHVAAPRDRAKLIVNPGKDPKACFQCHLETHAEFNLPQHHPLIEGKMNCVQCHDPHGADIFKPASGLAMARVNESCGNCHREQTKPVVFEHEALREGCTVCHNPHGSTNKKMLVQQDANLCLRCHAQNQGIFAGTGKVFIGATDHTQFLKRATCWTSGCHTAVHGSNVDVQLKY